VDDGATVPLFYENRIPELQLTNEQLNEDIYRVIEDAERNDEQQRKLERVLGKQYHLITCEERLDKIAADIVRHFTGRGFKGKAMVVCIDKLTAVRMFDKVKAAWAAHETKLKRRLAKIAESERGIDSASSDDVAASRHLRGHAAETPVRPTSRPSSRSC